MANGIKTFQNQIYFDKKLAPYVYMYRGQFYKNLKICLS
jgi:hypothetical protein